MVRPDAGNPGITEKPQFRARPGQLQHRLIHRIADQGVGQGHGIAIHRPATRQCHRSLTGASTILHAVEQAGFDHLDD